MKPHPTYHRIGDHTETLQIDFDPSKVTYEDLLNVYWASHNPTTPSWSRQYASMIFYHNEDQKKLAAETKQQEQLRRGKEIHTRIVPYTNFTRAEDYHQKYRLRNQPQIMREFENIYPEGERFADSTAAARVNGYLAGHGAFSRFKDELPEFGLSPEGEKRLLDIVAGRLD
jgi:peptide-methionine (S)-S-oxide reductase